MARTSSKKPSKLRTGAKPGATKRSPSRGEVVVPASLESVVEAVAKTSGVTVEKGWGSNSVALKVRGKIFAMLVRGDLVFKLPAARVDGLVSAGGAKHFDPRGDGRVMKEWVVLPPDAKGRVELARAALEFVGSAGKS